MKRYTEVLVGTFVCLLAIAATGSSAALAQEIDPEEILGDDLEGGNSAFANCTFTDVDVKILSTQTKLSGKLNLRIEFLAEQEAFNFSEDTPLDKTLDLTDERTEVFTWKLSASVNFSRSLNASASIPGVAQVSGTTTYGFDITGAIEDKTETKKKVGDITSFTLEPCSKATLQVEVRRAEYTAESRVKLQIRGRATCDIDAGFGAKTESVTFETVTKTEITATHDGVAGFKSKTLFNTEDLDPALCNGT